MRGAHDFGHALHRVAAVVVDLQATVQRRVLQTERHAMRKQSKQRQILEMARNALASLVGETFDVLTISKPQSAEETANLAKIVSKLSPLMGNLIEFKMAQFLNESRLSGVNGEWRRQDPGFPDVVLDSDITPSPGLEIKAWFPFATEITGRFKDSQTRFTHDEIDLAILAWLPDHLFWGKPKIIDVTVVSGRSVAEARDNHYHKPPRYIVLEPEDTATRTSNLQQTNTNGYVMQDNSQREIVRARNIVKSWGKDGATYKTSAEYQRRLKYLQGSVNYRLDTNYAKIDRIEHEQIEEFKARVLGMELFGRSVKQWASVMNNLPESAMGDLLK